jgi:hypothetical protein
MKLMQLDTTVRRCTYCRKRKRLTEFHRYGRGEVLVGKWCEKCYQRLNGYRLLQRRLNGARRRAMKGMARPPWADDAKIAEIYRLAEAISRVTGHPHHVEHWVPLLSTRVCGLHCELNLRVAPADLNVSKGNRFTERDAERVEQASMEWLRSRPRHGRWHGLP